MLHEYIRALIIKAQIELAGIRTFKVLVYRLCGLRHAGVRTHGCVDVIISWILACKNMHVMIKILGGVAPDVI